MQTVVDPKTLLLQRIEDKTAVVGVVGVGYVGLPFAVEKAKVGYHVVGIDRSAKRVEMINRGQNYIDDVKDEELRNLVSQGLIRATTSFEVVPELDIIVTQVATYPLGQKK